MISISYVNYYNYFIQYIKHIKNQCKFCKIPERYILGEGICAIKSANG